MADDKELKIYEKLLEIAKENAERDSRSETRMEDFGRRFEELEKQQKAVDKQLREIVDVIHDFKNIVNEFQKKQNKNLIQFQRIEKRFLSREQSDEVYRKNCSKRFDGIEENMQSIKDTPKNIMWKWFVKALEMFLVALISGAIVYLLTKWGIKR